MEGKITITNGSFCGRNEIAPKVAINMLLQGHAVLDGPESECRIRLTFKEMNYVPARAKSFKDSSPTPALATVQNEALYSGCRREGSPVTGTVNVLRKLRRSRMKSIPGRFLDWGERDVFPPHRFNPDEINPLYPTMSAFLRARKSRSPEFLTFPRRPAPA